MNKPTLLETLQIIEEQIKFYARQAQECFKYGLLGAEKENLNDPLFKEAYHKCVALHDLLTLLKEKGA